jgi:hypothetical protein
LVHSMSVLFVLMGGGWAVCGSDGRWDGCGLGGREDICGGECWRWYVKMSWWSFARGEGEVACGER